MNVRTVLEHLIDAAALARLKKSAGNVGWPRWFKIQLGKALIELAIKLRKRELGSATYRKKHGLYPHWMSRGRSRKPLASVTSPPPLVPEEHQWINFRQADPSIVRNDGTVLDFGRCELCMESAQARGSENKKYSPGGTRVNAGTYGCNICKVYICRSCHDRGLSKSYRHPGNCSGEANLGMRD